MDSELIERARAAAADLFPARGVLAAYAFGSRVAGTPRPDSDLDIGYYLLGHRDGARLSIRDELDLIEHLSGRIGVEVDLRDLGDAPLEVRGRVMEEGTRIFSADLEARVGLEADLLSRYHDYKAEFEELARIRLRRIAEKGLA